MILLFARTALASAIYPGEIYNHLGLEVAPPCAYCHQDGVTGLGTVQTPFGLTLYERGLRNNDPDNLTALLDEIEAEEVDSDGDGVSDVQELLDGTDPNVDDAGPVPQYGCLQTAPAVPSALLALLGLVVARRRGDPPGLSRG